MADDEPESTAEPETIEEIADDVDDLQEEIDAVGASILAALGEQALAIAALAGRLDEHVREHESHLDSDAEPTPETETAVGQRDETSTGSATDAPAMEESAHEQPTASDSAAEPPRRDRKPA